jgi:hypothetical protein
MKMEKIIVVAAAAALFGLPQYAAVAANTLAVAPGAAARVDFLMDSLEFNDIKPWPEINARSSGDVLSPSPVFDSTGFTIYGNEGQDTFTYKLPLVNTLRDTIYGNEGQDTFTHKPPAASTLQDTTYGNEGQNTLVAIWESSETKSISGEIWFHPLTDLAIESYSSEINSMSGGIWTIAIWQSSETKSISGEIWFHPLTDLAIESYSSEINSMSGGIWTNDGERKARGRQLLLTTYASLFFHLSLKFIRGWIPKTKLFSTNLFMTIPAFFLKESNKKEGNEKVDNYPSSRLAICLN